MSTDHINDQPDAEVVPLRAADAGTEIRTAESPGPAYTDLTDGRPAAAQAHHPRPLAHLGGGPRACEARRRPP
jgi:hypothetical protein